MKKAKTIQQGYFFLETKEEVDNTTKEGIKINNDKVVEESGKWLHFSMNAWVNLKEDSSVDIGTFHDDFEKEDEIGKYALICSVAYAAMKAYDQEEGNEIDYNIFKVRNMMDGLTAKQGEDFFKAMTHSMTPPNAGK